MAVQSSDGSETDPFRPPPRPEASGAEADGVGKSREPRREGFGTKPHVKRDRRGLVAGGRSDEAKRECLERNTFTTIAIPHKKRIAVPTFNAKGNNQGLFRL
ncbi:predicted protein [Coccidioides posadasii str. Silveira]|uniref:Predicted protein n=1 Tax=Coccidioides posadasii (strain RMSCC 757 / Silveira) TaxID=443226 RepID=E9DK02_COCPS|nr:predicted protein [Coccidioides posadasii str. Silveira]